MGKEKSSGGSIRGIDARLISVEVNIVQGTGLQLTGFEGQIETRIQNLEKVNHDFLHTNFLLLTRNHFQLYHYVPNDQCLVLITDQVATKSKSSEDNFTLSLPIFRIEVFILILCGCDRVVGTKSVNLTFRILFITTRSFSVNGETPFINSDMYVLLLCPSREPNCCWVRLSFFNRDLIRLFRL